MTTRSEKVECPTCKSNPGEPCAALAANGVTRLGYIPIPHSERQQRWLKTVEEKTYSITCPKCGAGAGVRCRSAQGHPQQKPHASRAASETAKAAAPGLHPVKRSCWVCGGDGYTRTEAGPCRECGGTGTTVVMVSVPER